ncbi:MAG: amidase family protein [Candidatus Marsarchaeota archaeon]|nr:amidase family protein [Candidatus Marsarchaeota archaeon]
MNSIEEFYSLEKKSDYAESLFKDLSDLNSRLNAFLNITKISSQNYPFSVKDNICVKNVETTASSKILKTYVPPFNATVVERMLSKNFGFIGKTNMDEFGFGTFGLNSERIPRNPFNEEYVAGGSSSGAAIATAVLKYHIAIAESTGGSISAPSAFCGVVGFTPTYGAVSRHGLIDYANSLDKIGLMSRHAKDIRYVFDIIKGPDNYDSTCIDIDKRKIQERKEETAKNTIFIINQINDFLDESVKSHFSGLISKLENMGFTIKTIDFNLLDKAIPTYYIISMAEASTNLARYTGFKYGLKNNEFSQDYNSFFTESRSNFGAEAKRRIILGTFVRGASVKSKYYSKALKVRGLLISKMKEILRHGFILSPTMPIATPKIEDANSLTPVQNYGLDILTIPPNLSGFPHISFPYDYDKELPMGAQLISDHFDDYSLLDFVQNWEDSFKYKFKYNLGSI